MDQMNGPDEWTDEWWNGPMNGPMNGTNRPNEWTNDSETRLNDGNTCFSHQQKADYACRWIGPKNADEAPTNLSHTLTIDLHAERTVTAITLAGSGIQGTTCLSDIGAFNLYALTSSRLAAVDAVPNASHAVGLTPALSVTQVKTECGSTGSGYNSRDGPLRGAKADPRIQSKQFDSMALERQYLAGGVSPLEP